MTEERFLGDWFDSAKKTVSKHFEEDNKKYLTYVRKLITEHVRKIYVAYFRVKPETLEELRDQQREFDKFELELRSILSDLNQNTLACVLELCSNSIVDGLLDSLGTTRKILEIEADPLILPILRSIWSLSHRSTPDNSLIKVFEEQSNFRVKADKQHQGTLSASIDEESVLPSEEAPLPQPVKKKLARSKRTRDGESIPSKLETVDESSAESESDTASSTEPSKPKHQPHDKFVKRTLQVIPIAIDLFQQVLSKDDLEYIDLSTLKLMDTTFIGDDMEKRIANTAFIVKLMSEERYLYLLVKHLSSPDESVLDKINGYQGQVLRHRNNFNKQEKEKYLIRVLTLVLYTGKGKLSQTICSRDSFRPDGCDSSIYLLNLREETEETLKIRFKAFLPAALALKMVRNNMRPNEIPEIALQGLRQHTEYINMLNTYIFCAAPSNERDAYEEVLKGILEDDVATIEEDDAWKEFLQSAIRSRDKEIVKNMSEAGWSDEDISKSTKIRLEDIIKYKSLSHSYDKQKKHSTENDNEAQLVSNGGNPSHNEDNDINDSRDIDISTLHESTEQNALIIKAFVDSCTNCTLPQNDELVAKIKKLEDTWLRRHKICIESQYIFPTRPSGTDGCSSKPRIVQRGNGKSDQELEELFYQILSESPVLELVSNTTWGINNCMFEAIAHSPEVIEEIVDIFGCRLSVRDIEETKKVRNDDRSYTEGGKIFRRIVCQWILDNMDKVIFEEISGEPGGAPQLTVMDIFRSIDNSQDPTIYITNLRESDQFIDEEISVIISVMIKRPIIILTEAEPQMLTSRLLDSLVSRNQLEKERIYLHNDSRSQDGTTASGTHYSRLKVVQGA